jgi:hypothetical protein
LNALGVGWSQGPVVQYKHTQCISVGH